MAGAAVGSPVGGPDEHAPQPLSFQAEYVGVVPVASSTLSEVRVTACECVDRSRESSGVWFPHKQPRSRAAHLTRRPLHGAAAALSCAHAHERTRSLSRDLTITFTITTTITCANESRTKHNITFITCTSSQCTHTHAKQQTKRTHHTPSSP
jgi:hypothetical protein